jgi:hypothetical protein
MAVQERRGEIAIDQGAAEMIMRIQYGLCASILALSCIAAAAQPANWRRYVVPETGASADIPLSIFTEDAGKPETGYGARFLTADRRANLTIQSVPNEGLAPARFFATKNPPSDIVYKKITDRFFVASSFRNNMIWYNRCNFAGPYANCVLINYPAAEKRQWDSIVTRISNTLASRQ